MWATNWGRFRTNSTYDFLQRLVFAFRSELIVAKEKRNGLDESLALICCVMYNELFAITLAARA